MRAHMKQADLYLREKKIADAEKEYGALSGERLERGAQEPTALIASPPAGMLKTTLAGAHHRPGMILEKQGRKDEARAEYTQALAIDPTNQAARKSLSALK